MLQPVFLLMMTSPRIAILFLILLSGCDALVYSPEGDHFVAVSQEPAHLQVNWSLAPDTVNAWGTISFQYDVASDVGNDVLIGLVIADTLMTSVEFGEALTFNTKTKTDGHYPVQLVAIARSGTGSLADVLGGEFQAALTDPKTLRIDNGPIGSVPITSFEQLEDGSLKMTWQQYARPRARGYAIRETTTCAGYCARVSYLPIEQTSWIDMAFDGKRRSYSIIVLDTIWQSYGFGPTSTVEVGYPPISFTVAQAEGYDDVQLRWTESNYPNVFESYQIVKKNGFGNLIPIATITDIHQTDISFPTFLGTRETWYLAITTTNDPASSGYKNIMDSLLVETGRPLGPIGHSSNVLVHNADMNTYFQHTGSEIRLLDANLMPLQTREVPTGYLTTFNLSMDKRYYVLTSYSDVTIVDVRTLEEVSRFSLRGAYPHLNTPHPHLTLPVLDHQDRLWYQTAYFSSTSSVLYTNRGVSVVDTKTGRAISELERYTHGTSVLSVHPDGTRVLGRLADGDDISLYQWQSSKWNQIREYSGSVYTFMPDGESLFMRSNLTLSRKGVELNETRMSFNLPADFILFSYDHIEGHFSYGSETLGAYEIRSMTDGSLLHTIPLQSLVKNGTYRFSNGLLWTRTGLYEEIGILENL